MIRNRDYEVPIEISNRKFNLIMGLIILYGIVSNIVTCTIIDKPFSRKVLIGVFIAYFISCLIGIILSKKSSSWVISFIGYNLVVVPVGVLLSQTLLCFGGINSPIVLEAFVITAAVTFLMVLSGILFPNFYSKIGNILFVALVGLLIMRILFMFLNIDPIIFSWIGAALFSLYIGYDFYKSQDNAKTLDNAVDSALDMYLDIVNLFLNILSILSDRNK